MRRKLSWSVPEGAPPKHPYRDTLLVYTILSIVIVLVAWATGGPVGKAIAIAILFFVAATGWTMLKFRSQLRERSRRDL